MRSSGVPNIRQRQGADLRRHLPGDEPSSGVPLNLYDFFKGNWTLRREIISASGELLATAAGTATFNPGANPNELLYNEEGQIQTAVTSPFFRSYRYILSGDQVHVYFADGMSTGELYQTYKLTEMKLVADLPHLCGPDTYDGAYDLIGAEAFRLTNIAEGPRKNFTILTTFSRDARS